MIAPPPSGVVDVWVGRAGAGFARRVLRHYLGEAPVIVHGEFGKPALLTGELQFSLSHSAGLAALAVTVSHPVGVDVEHLRSGPDPLAFARRFLAPREAGALAALPEPRRAAALLRLWTAKEAYVKALGTGLAATPPRSFVLDGLSVATTHDGAPGSAWSLTALGLPAGYFGTVALRAPSARLRLLSAGA